MKNYILIGLRSIVCLVAFSLLYGYLCNDAYSKTDTLSFHIGTADAGPNIITYVGVKTEFNGQASTPTGERVKYEWDFNGDGYSDWASDQTGKTSYIYLKPGNYKAIFRVYDEEDKQLPESIAMVIVREGRGLPVFIPKMRLQRSNADKLKAAIEGLKRQFNICKDEEEFLRLKDYAQALQEKVLLQTTNMPSNALPADGISKRYVITSVR